MSLYPTLEDMKVDHMAQAQMQHEAASQGHTQPQVTYPQQQQPPLVYPQQGAGGSMYPSLQGEYMGMQLTPQAYQQYQLVPQQPMAVGVRQTSGGQTQVAPITGNNKGVQRAEIKQGIRQVIACKDADNKIGLRLRHVNKGLFVALVQDNSPASLAGLRFGDQILQIDDKDVAGWDTDKAHKVLKNASADRIVFAVRDRPFERTISMQKDSNGYIGFVFKDGKIKSLVKDSSAARNGVLIEHQLIEVNGQNVVGLKDDKTGEIFDAAGRTVTITIMPTFIYDHIVKCMGNSIIKKLMDHSIPDV
ncbi:syntenin-1-like isoform X2 [Mizuhopecten yessoensis]|uniref:Syntenin-1 n=1 Tax=Mizuhopecten yessoensis TaxID=6573 RepID=A0A210QAJ9_MIZYE|nr:syntenin-1-like isoform X1 [Mizuhopecten yessoensis]XP_021363160.1 syntenin-1-like isoform X2 [Mizuhopecten yessoensis]OWF45763.1 Syntenin-1 [Mizuhopecten yessoensis]